MQKSRELRGQLGRLELNPNEEYSYRTFAFRVASEVTEPHGLNKAKASKNWLMNH